MTTKRNHSTKADTIYIQQHLETEHFPKLAYLPTHAEIAKYVERELHMHISDYLAGRFIREYFGPYTGKRDLGKVPPVEEKKEEVITIGVNTVITDEVFAAILRTALDFYVKDNDHAGKDLRMAILKSHGIHSDKRLNRAITEANKLRKEQIADMKADVNIFLYDNYFAQGRKLPTATKLIWAVKAICPMMNMTALREIIREYKALHVGQDEFPS